jgi:hypothetical protein
MLKVPDKSIQYDGEFIKVVIIPGFKEDEPGQNVSMTTFLAE